MASRVFDFSDEDKKIEAKDRAVLDPSKGMATGTIEQTSHMITPEHPMFVLYDEGRTLVHHTSGKFIKSDRGVVLEYGKSSDQLYAAVSSVDKRFVDFVNWMGETNCDVRLSGTHTGLGYAVTKCRAVDSTGRARLKSADEFMQTVIERLTESDIPENEPEEDDENDSDSVYMSDMTSIQNFMKAAGKTLPENIRKWAYRNIELTSLTSISPDERRHARRALSIMLNIHWHSSHFESIDPVRARKILDEELFGMDRVKQRIIETIIQINRTHTLPAYGLLLAGPAGVGKSQIAYAVAKILGLPWTSLDMSSIRDAEALTGSPRVYANAKPGRIMEAYQRAGSSNLVFIINELDKADQGSQGANPADALLTLLDNLGFTDNYIECTVPTGGVYPIATANDKSRISEPLMTRFALIDIPDYTPEEKKEIFLRFSFPKVLKRMSMTESECRITDDGARAVIERYRSEPGVRDLEQAAEHIAANALFHIESEKKKSVTYDRADVLRLLD
jgi:ATP-dependent Lon protease